MSDERDPDLDVLEERILEVALGRMFEEESEPAGDRVERILAAWKRGVSGSGIEDLDLGDSPPLAAPRALTDSRASDGNARAEHNGQRPGRDATQASERADGGPARWRRPALRAAAALVVLGAGVATWRLAVRGPAGPHLRADRSVAQRAESAGGDREGRTRTVLPGALVTVDAGSPVRFAAPPSAAAPAFTLVAQPGASFSWWPAPEDDAREGRGARVRVLAGEVALATRATLSLECAAAAVSVGPGSEISAHVHERLALALGTGSARLSYAGLEQELEPGEAREVPRDPEEWWKTTGRMAEVLSADLPRRDSMKPGFNPDVWLEERLAFDALSEKLFDVLAGDPLAWEVVGQQFARQLAERDAYEASRPAAQLDFLTWQLSPRAALLASELWVEHPEAFGEHHLVAFASLGGFEFERELRALVESRAAAPPAPAAPAAPGAPAAPAVPGFRDAEEFSEGVVAAAYFAARGDDVGRPLLESFAPPRGWTGAYASMAGWSNALLAAAALGWLGDPGPWEDLLPYLRREVDTALEQGLPTYAVMSLAFAEVHLAGGEGVLGRLPLDIGFALQFVALRERAETNGQIRDLFEDLAARW